MAYSVPTAGIEAAHGFEGRVAPLTLCSYDVEVEDVVDLTSAAQRRAAAVKPGELNCAWRLDLSNGIEPASWRIAKKLIADGVTGILVPSYAAGARRSDKNLVLWKWSGTAPHKVNVYDPSGSLPVNKSSWTKPPP
jgi:RES domain-containing protein